MNEDKEKEHPEFCRGFVEASKKADIWIAQSNKALLTKLRGEMEEHHNLIRQAGGSYREIGILDQDLALIDKYLNNA